MNIDYLRYFIKLAEVKHYTRAAEQLCIAQPILSHAISQLESELGVPLFEKNGRNTDMTRFGEEFLECAKKTVASLDEGILSLKKSAEGEGVIRLGFVRPLGISYVPSVAAEFLGKNKTANVNFEFHSGSTGYLLKGLSEGKYDMVFCSEPENKANFSYFAVTQQDLVLIVPKNHVLAKKHSIDLKEAVPYPMICFSKEAGLRAVIDRLFEKIGKTPNIAYETDEDEVIAGLVAKNFGIAVVPYMDLLLKLDVAILQISSPEFKREFFLVSNDKLFMSPVAQNFREFVRERNV